MNRKTLLAEENHLEPIARRRAKIVCTLGPASNTEDQIRQLLALGMDVARLNFSHGSHEEHLDRIRTLRRVAAEMGRSVCILQDLQGPKIRTSALKNHTPVNLVKGSRVTITNKEIEGTAELLGTTFKTLAREAEPGSRILLSDGRLSLKVLKVRGDDVLCEVIDGGMLGEHQGINLPGAVLSVPSLTAKDKKDLAFGLSVDVDAVAISFVRSAKDVRAVKKIIAAAGSDTPVIAKLEKPQAIENLEEILEITDGVMVARGDLGVEVPPETVPIIQKHVIRRALHWRKPVITATQMLDSMIQNPRPTRAEASDVANAIYDGSDAVMLSGETATGKYPREAVSMMARIVVEAEADIRNMSAERRREERELTIPEAICESVAHVAEELKLRGIAVFTATGNTAGLISKYRPRAEIYAFSPVACVCNRLNLYWGVRPVLIEPPHTVEEMIQATEAELRRTAVVTTNDIVGIVGGTRMVLQGSTNFMRLHRIRPDGVSSVPTAKKKKTRAKDSKR
ncbi:MAG TPA: pyruvate kinase [Candidatus Saccharimonadales bacterium]|nr:pyruvate kinase [Candidatus Saccharimonadales bacterium]